MRAADVLDALDHDQLGPLVAGSRSWRQVLLPFGLRHRHVPALQHRCRELGISTEHLRAHGPPEPLLRDVVATATSWVEALTRLGYAPSSGSARSTVRAHAQRLGLDVTRLDDPPVPVRDAFPLQADAQHLRSAGSSVVAAVLLLCGHRVSWPLEPAPYDLVADLAGRMLRLQVKTTSHRARGSWTCSLTRSEYADVAGGKRQVRYSAQDIDAFAVVDGDGHVYLIPLAAVAGRSAISLHRYEGYRVPVGVCGLGPGRS